MCQICLQPFVQPIDTPCGHTFCHVCIHNYLKVNPMCPLDRKPLNEMTCSPSNLVLKRYNFLIVLMSVRFIILEISLRVEVLLENGLIRLVFDSCIVREDRSGARGSLSTRRTSAAFRTLTRQ